MKENSLFDCHVHVDNVYFRNTKIASFFGKRIDDLRIRGPTPEQISSHISKDHLVAIFAIYENPETIIKLRQINPNRKILGMFFIRDPRQPDESLIQSLFENDLLQGIKLHPVLDNYQLTNRNLVPVLNLARRFRVPVLFHSDDRKEFMELTAPECQKELVTKNPEIVFIIGHGGAYAHPRIVGKSRQVESYWEGKVAPYSRKYLIWHALWLAWKYNNVFYDLSVATNPIKAQMITEFVNEYPEVAEKILIGTDFPINFSSAVSQLQALERAGLKHSLLKRVSQNKQIGTV